MSASSAPEAVRDVPMVAGRSATEVALPPPLPPNEPAWAHGHTEGWLAGVPQGELGASGEHPIWPLWHHLGAAATDVLHPIQNSWALLLACVPALCLLLDRWLGEPANRWHPVVWMGTYLGFWGRRLAPRWGAPRRSPARVWWAGTLAWWGGALIVLGVALAVQTVVLRLPIWLAVPALALVLKPMLAWAMLHDEVLAVEAALARSLPEGRARLSRLVSRDTTELDAVTVRESAIETLAENLCDSVVAPLFWFALLGLPGAALYRFANTADAMWGYKGERRGRDWTHFGQWTARTDDVLNWVPARITAALLMLGSGVAAWRQLPVEARKTPSPNGGWTMGAMALRLNVRLSKPGSYQLHAQGQAAQPVHTVQAAQHAGVACVLSTVLASLTVLGCVLWGGLTGVMKAAGAGTA